jgi:hypothetical protein
MTQPIFPIAKMEDLEAAIRTLPPFDPETLHTLSNGMYARTITIPAGGVLTGAEHKTDHLCVLFGDITVTTDEGMKRLTGFNVLKVKAGAKRAGYAHQITHWATICRTGFESLEDLPKIEDELVFNAESLVSRMALPMNKSEVLA